LAGRQVTLGGNFSENLCILVIVKVMPVGIEDAVSPQSEWLVDLKVKADRSHGLTW